MHLLILILVFFLAACGSERAAVLSGSTMGTQFNIKIANDVDGKTELQNDVEAALAHIEDTLSTYREDSEISRFNAAQTTDWYTVSDEFCASVEQAQVLSEMTTGAFDITVGPLVDLWGFGPGEIGMEPPPDEQIAALMPAIGYRHLETDCERPALKKSVASLTLDMSAFGKGLAVDRIAELLEAHGLADYLVEIGGELRLAGLKPDGEEWAIGIEKPSADTRQPQTVLRITNTAMATSGDYRNFFEAGGRRYSHAIDTRTGRPVTHRLSSVTVVDPSSSRADALATALLVMGPEEGMDLATRENLAVLFLVRTDGGFDTRTSPAFKRLESDG